MRTSRRVLEPGNKGAITEAATKAGCGVEGAGWGTRDEKEGACACAALGVFVEEGWSTDDRLGSTLPRGDSATRCASKKSILKKERG